MFALLCQVCFAYLLADLFSGVLHWIEDTYNVHKLFICANRYHHIKPHAMVKHGIWFTIDTSVYLTVPLALLNAATAQNILLYLVLLFGSFANLIHKWSHTIKAKLPAPVRIMQATGLFCSPRHHRKHHLNNLTCYCAMTNYLNPLLDSIKFWRGLEHLIYAATRIAPRTKTDREVVDQCIDDGYLH